MNSIAPGLWTLRYPLTVMGTDHGRTVTVIRLSSGKLIIHSMAPFTAPDLEAIRSAGEPAWLVEAMLLHDTYAAQGPARFPGLPLLGPPGFAEIVRFPVHPLRPPPPEWEGEVEVLALQGVPKLEEHLFLHIPSRTLIVADLVFNFRADEAGWNRFFHRHIAGLHGYPAMSRVFRWCVSDKSAFRRSLEAVMERDFDRIIPGHGETIGSGGKELLRGAMVRAGFL